MCDWPTHILKPNDQWNWRNIAIVEKFVTVSHFPPTSSIFYIYISDTTPEILIEGDELIICRLTVPLYVFKWITSWSNLIKSEVIIILKQFNVCCCYWSHYCYPKCILQMEAEIKANGCQSFGINNVCNIRAWASILLIFKKYSLRS